MHSVLNTFINVTNQEGKLKLDFAIAFDIVEHVAILKIMKHMGFPEKWLPCMNLLFTSGFSPFMDMIERRLTACSSRLSVSGRLQMVNSVITPTIIYPMHVFGYETKWDVIAPSQF